MGQTPSAIIYGKLYHILPEVSGSSHGSWFNKENKPFASDKDRDQFIHAVITVISNNGELQLKDYQFRLLFSRRGDNSVIARIVAELDGVIRAKVEPDGAGKDQTEAFLVLKRDVERKLERILQDVPGDGFSDGKVDSPKSPGSQRVVGATYGFCVSNGAGPSRSRERQSVMGGTSGSAAEGRISEPQDAPPAYDGGTVRLNHPKK